MRVRLVLLAALLSLAASAGAQQNTSQSDQRATPPDTAVRVTASRREVRVVFPRDDAESWGWSADTNVAYTPFYDWAMMLDGLDGPRILRLFIGRSGATARRFPSLDSLVAVGQPSLALPSMMAGSRTTANASATVEERHVVLAIRDTAVIARLFGLRPATVQTWHSRPLESPRYGTKTVAVEYVEPQIPVPDEKAMAEGRASLRQFEKSISSISRRIVGTEDDVGTALWVAVGDTLLVQVHEAHCRYDSCIGKTVPVHDSLWAVRDSSILVLRRRASAPAKFWFDAHASFVVRRPGHTSLRIVLPPMASDTAPSNVAPPRTLARDVVVTRPLARLAFVPRTATVHRGEIVTVRLRAIDVDGRRYANPPARIDVQDAAQSYVTRVSDPMRFSFGTVGTHTVVATRGVLADTLTIRVLPAP